MNKIVVAIIVAVSLLLLLSSLDSATNIGQILLSNNPQAGNTQTCPIQNILQKQRESPLTNS